MARPQLIAEQRSMLGLRRSMAALHGTAAARMAVARRTARWEVARMAAGDPTLRWEHPMAAVGPMAAVSPMAVVRLTAAAHTAAGQAAITAEATAALVSFGRPISGCDGVPIG
jgi:hypothetical protein